MERTARSRPLSLNDADGQGVCFTVTQATSAEDRLRVISYNVQFLPLQFLNRRPNGPYRVREQVRRLIDYDIVGLNEVFQSARRQQLLTLFRRAWNDDFHYVAPGPSHQSIFGIDSGLVLLSRWPIEASHLLVFGNDSRIRKYGVFADGFAAKGAIHARILLPSISTHAVRLDAFLTHLEYRDAARREQQYKLLAGFINAQSSPELPALVMGDFNTPGEHIDMNDPGSQYHRLLNELDSVRRPWIDVGLFMERSDWGTRDPARPDGGKRIDYIFLSNPVSGAQLQPLTARTHHFPDPKVAFLSDHCAVEAVFRW